MSGRVIDHQECVIPFQDGFIRTKQVP